MQVLARDELQRFLIQAKAEGYYELFLLDLATGLRRGELLALQWNDLDFETGVLTISKQVSLVRGQDRDERAEDEKLHPQAGAAACRRAGVERIP